MFAHRTRAANPAPPPYWTPEPPIRDALETESSTVQRETARACRALRVGGDAWPGLQRQKHVAFLRNSLGTLPAGFVAVDASRPWMLYWALTGLYLLGEDVSEYRERVISTLAPMQSREGGFGGGHGQMAHCAASYAAVLSLIIVGGDDALALVDRRALWRWLGQLKQPDGGFALCIGGEEDVRGAYCAMVMISLLNLPLQLPPASPAKSDKIDTFLTGLPEYLSRCQTFEGGISGAPNTEAHGAYAFCALATLCILGDPATTLDRYLDLPRLISWLSARQYAPEGGFAGRTNKLVDGCYSHWVGGCWPLVEAALRKRRPSPSAPSGVEGSCQSLYSRNDLIGYILCCCQDKRGGLRDKPGKGPDSYHSCYALAGLSSAQHLYSYVEGHSNEDVTSSSLPDAFRWVTSIREARSTEESIMLRDEDRVSMIHPIFVLPWGAAERTQLRFAAEARF